MRSSVLHIVFQSDEICYVFVSCPWTCPILLKDSGDHEFLECPKGWIYHWQHGSHVSSFKYSVTETIILRFSFGRWKTVQFPSTMIFLDIPPLINQTVRFECQLVGFVATHLSTGNPRPIGQAFGHRAQQLVGEGSWVVGQQRFDQQGLGGTLGMLCH